MEIIQETKETTKVKQRISFELAIIDEKEPVKLTAALIREKSKKLTDLKIISIFDEVGYKAVKAATIKAVKTRTSIEKKEKEILDAMKLRHTSEKKGVTDYTAELYTACREAQTTLENKLKVIDDAKAVEAKRLADEELARTKGREDKMFSLGLTWNGQQFIGYGKAFSKEGLFAMNDEHYESFVSELEGLQIEQGVTGIEKPHPNIDTPVQHIPHVSSVGWGSGKSIHTAEPKTHGLKAFFENAVYQCAIDGYLIILTKGEVKPLDGQLVCNDRVMDSAIYNQVILNYGI